MISIVVPIYNSGKYIRACIDSILQQSFADFELILIDDGSTDDSFDICKEYKDPRIILKRIENKGVSHARNIGLSFAKGNYITFVDSDDTLPRSALFILNEAIKTNNVDMVTGAHALLYGSKKIPHSQRLSPGIYEYKDLQDRMIDDGTLSGFMLGSVCGSLYRMEIIKKYRIRFNENIKNNEDGLFNFDFAVKSKNFLVVNDIVYFYHQYSSESNSKKFDSKACNEQIYSYITNTISDNAEYNIKEQFKKRDVSLALWDILNCNKSIAVGDSIRFIKRRLNEKDVIAGIQVIKYRDLSRYKKIFFILMKYKCYVMLFVLARFIVPFMMNKTAR